MIYFLPISLKIFVTIFNLGFGSIKWVICNGCLTYIQDCYRQGTTKNSHSKAKAFFQNLNKFPMDTSTINFDLIQNQLLPKTQIKSKNFFLLTLPTSTGSWKVQVEENQMKIVLVFGTFQLSFKTTLWLQQY